MKKANLLIAASLIALGAQAEALSPAEALARVGSTAARRIAARSVNIKPELTIARHSGVPELYVFAPAEGGLLVLSADSDAPALLGYSENFVAGEQLPPALEMMLEGYAEEIDAIRTGAEPYSASRADSEDFKAITPICITTWNQTNPYNEQTPVINGTHTPTGCVATAMAQVLKVYEYPAKCSGGTFSYDNAGTTLSINFNDVTLEWDKMLQKYSGSNDPAANRTAIATLMKALGYAAKTGYKTSASGASTPNMVTGLVNYFDYDDSAIALDRQWFSLAKWEKMVYDELAAGHPVFYSGLNNKGGGHAFVIDGYKGDGLYHVNWGWGGLSDGYFVLTALDPQQQGVGGSTAGYNLSNSAIFNLRPGKTTAYSDVPLTFFGLGGFKATQNKALLGYDATFAYTVANGEVGPVYNRAPVNAIQPCPAIKLVAEDGTEYFGHSSKVDYAVVQPLYGMRCGSIQIPANLPEGTYVCSPMAWSAVTQKYYPIYFPITNAYKFEATVEGRYITFGPSEAPTAKVTTFTLPNEIKTNVPFAVKGKIVNTSDEDFDAKICLGLYDAGKITRRASLGEVFGKLESGKVGEFNTQATLTNTSIVSGTYDLAFYNSSTNKIVSGVQTVQVIAPVDAATIRVSKITCNSATVSNLEFSINVAATEGDFNGQIYVEIQQEGQTGYVERFQSKPLQIAAKQSETVVVGDEFKDGTVGEEYTARVYYWHAGEYVEAPNYRSCTFTLTNSTTIDEVIEVEASADAVFYDLSGRRVVKPAKGGIYISKSRKIKF